MVQRANSCSVAELRCKYRCASTYKEHITSQKYHKVQCIYDTNLLHTVAQPNPASTGAEHFCQPTGGKKHLTQSLFHRKALKASCSLLDAVLIIFSTNGHGAPCAALALSSLGLLDGWSCDSLLMPSVINARINCAIV